jgi:hypothetical protein
MAPYESASVMHVFSEQWNSGAIDFERRASSA